MKRVKGIAVDSLNSETLIGISFDWLQSKAGARIAKSVANVVLRVIFIGFGPQISGKVWVFAIPKVQNPPKWGWR